MAGKFYWFLAALKYAVWPNRQFPAKGRKVFRRHPFLAVTVTLHNGIDGLKTPDFRANSLSLRLISRILPALNQPNREHA